MCLMVAFIFTWKWKAGQWHGSAERQVLLQVLVKACLIDAINTAEVKPKNNLLNTETPFLNGLWSFQPVVELCKANKNSQH